MGACEEESGLNGSETTLESEQFSANEKSPPYGGLFLSTMHS